MISKIKPSLILCLLFCTVSLSVCGDEKGFIHYKNSSRVNHEYMAVLLHTLPDSGTAEMVLSKLLNIFEFEDVQVFIDLYTSSQNIHLTQAQGLNSEKKARRILLDHGFMSYAETASKDDFDKYIFYIPGIKNMELPLYTVACLCYEYVKNQQQNKPIRHHLGNVTDAKNDIMPDQVPSPRRSNSTVSTTFLEDSLPNTPTMIGHI